MLDEHGFPTKFDEGLRSRLQCAKYMPFKHKQINSQPVCFAGCMAVIAITKVHSEMRSARAANAHGMLCLGVVLAWPAFLRAQTQVVLVVYESRVQKVLSR